MSERDELSEENQTLMREKNNAQEEKSHMETRLTDLEEEKVNFSKVSHFLERTLMEHTDMKNTLDSKLQVYSIRSIRIRSISYIFFQLMFLAISQFLERTLIDHIDMKNRLDSKLQFCYICSIEILSRK